MRTIQDLLRFLKESGGSDLHLAAGLQPRARIKGALRPVDGTAALTDATLRALLRPIATDEQWSEFERASDLDFAYGIPGVARFRANYFVQHNGAGAVFRVVPEEVLSLDKLAMPAAVRRFAHLSAGLVLVTGPTGSGKSTTLAAVINEINETYAKHIVTIEDPIEFVHDNKKSVMSQREVGAHTDSFGGALRAAMRQNPDVVLVGEMRDQETIELAITAAEMGVLVFGTLHTNSAAKTVDRLIDAFPAEEQEQVRLSLSDSLAGVVSQLLLKTADGAGRVAALEILVRTSALPNLIREGNTPQLGSLIQNGKAQGMCTMDDSLQTLLDAGRITARDAYMKALDKTRFERLVSAEQELA